MLQLFLKFELQKLITYFKTGKLAKLITIGLFVVVFTFVGIGLYYFFLSGFRFIHFSVEQDIQLPLTLFIYELFLLVMAGVIVFSVIVSGIFSLFRGQYDAWIISSPGFKLFPRIVLMKGILTSSWPLFVMFLPAILAFNKIYHLEVITLFFILISVVTLLILLNTLSLLVILFISSLYYRITKKIKFIRFTFGGLVALLLLIITGITIKTWNVVSGIDLVKLFKADDVDVTINLQNISSHFYLSPTHPLALQIVNWQERFITEALMNFIVLIGLTSLITFIWWKVSIIFYPLWQKFQEISTQTVGEPTTSKISLSTYYFTGSKTMALFKKEALVLSRNMKGVLWFLFLFGLWLAQVGTNIILSHNIIKHQTDVSEKLAVFQALQFIIAIYFICSFSLRFVFPSFSVEKKTSWILGSAPLSFTKLFFSKYLFYTSFFVVLGSLMSYVNVRVLNLDVMYSLYSMSLFIIAVIFIVTLALSFGAIFPSKETDDPEAISTSMSGLFFTALSLLYGGLSSLTLYTTLLRQETLPLVLFEVFTLLLVGVLLLLTPSIATRKTLF